MGGYCAFYGEDDAEGKTLDDPRAYSRQSVWKRMFTVLMGPGMNFVLAFAVLMLYFWIGGAQVPVAAHPYISQVESGPAQEAGCRPGRDHPHRWGGCAGRHHRYAHQRHCRL